MWPHRRQPTRLPRPWDSPGKNPGVGCHFLQCMKVKNESEVAQSCPTSSNPMDCSLPGSSVHGIFQARLLEWGAISINGYNSTYQELDSVSELHRLTSLHDPYCLINPIFTMEKIEAQRGKVNDPGSHRCKWQVWDSKPGSWVPEFMLLISMLGKCACLWAVTVCRQWFST